MRQATATLVASINNGSPVPAELNIETEQIDVTTSGTSKPDMMWTYVDHFDHFHAWDDKGELPTLTTKTEHVEVDGDEDDEAYDYDRTYYVCTICGEPVEPRTKWVPSLGREFAPGRTSWRVEVPGDFDGDVSVKVTRGEYVYFGVGRASRHSFEGPGRTRTWIYGTGPLGHRKAST